MKVNGQLEVAQFEQLAADPALLPTARVWANILNPAAALLKFFDGTRVQTLQFASASTLNSQNSGQAVTVDWSTGLNQEVVLTNHCLISFTNPQAGQFHRLVVTQKTYNTSKQVYQYKLNMIDQDSARGSYQPQGALQPSENKVFTWYYTAGIRAAYATVPAALANPVSNPSEAVSGIDISPDGANLFYGRPTTPFSANHQFFDVGARAFIGAINFSAPSAAAAKIISTRFSPDGSISFGVSGTTPFLQSFTTDRASYRAGPVFFPNPGTLPAGAGASLDVHPSGTHVIIGHATTPFMSCYPFDSAGFGAKLANPGTLPAAQVNGVAFSPMGDYVATVGPTTPFLQVWPFDPIAGAFGTIIANPATLPLTGCGATLGKAVAWRPQGDFIACGDGTHVYVTGFNRITGAFTSTQISDTPSAASATCMQWTPDGQYLIVGFTASPFLKIYDFSGGGLGTNVTFDVSAPAAQVNDIVVDPSGRFMVLALNASPWVQGFPLPTKVRNYLRV